MAQTFYVTTPIFYPNARPHMGHAYTTVIADALARYHRLTGDDVYFLTGTDEHTQKVVREARKQGKSPHVYADENVESFKRLYNALDISYDQFIRTSDTIVHWPGAIKLWEALVRSGDIYKASYEGLYCVGHEAFVTKKDLDEEGNCPDHGVKPEYVKEENYFFKLSRYTGTIKKSIERGELAIVPETRKHEILSLLEHGLEDVSFSRPTRSGSCGIPVPGDDSQIMYVWCDALANYITALGYGRDEEQFTMLWPANYHVIGKDILRFHAAIWPGMLLSAGLPVPKTILVHGMITSGGKKMSKTLGNIIDPQELIDEYGHEAVRYYLCRHVSPFSDGDLTKDGFKEAYNGELAKGLGNVVARIMKLAETHLPEPIIPPSPRDFPKAFTGALEACELNVAMDVIWKKMQALDRRVTAEEPFKLMKTDPEKGRAIIRELAAELYWIGNMLYPFMPKTNVAITEAVKKNKMPPALFPRKDS